MVAVLFLDGPEETAGFVQVDVIGPTVEGGEALVAGSGSSAAIERAVSAGTVPGHPNEERTVVPPIGRPPRFGVGHQGIEILLYGGEVEFFECLSVIEAFVHRVG